MASRYANTHTFLCIAQRPQPFVLILASNGRYNRSRWVSRTHPFCLREIINRLHKLCHNWHLWIAAYLQNIANIYHREDSSSCTNRFPVMTSKGRTSKYQLFKCLEILTDKCVKEKAAKKADGRDGELERDKRWGLRLGRVNWPRSDQQHNNGGCYRICDDRLSGGATTMSGHQREARWGRRRPSNDRLAVCGYVIITWPMCYRSHF